MLRTFLRPGYEQFYSQAFDLAVANLRLRNIDPGTPEPLNSLSQALIIVFKESFPLARESLKDQGLQFNPQLLDATRIQLDKAYPSGADLENAYMPEASLREADLDGTKLSGANLQKANLTKADLTKVTLTNPRIAQRDVSSSE